jgi:hypothetical protein
MPNSDFYAKIMREKAIENRLVVEAGIEGYGLFSPRSFTDSQVMALRQAEDAERKAA